MSDIQKIHDAIDRLQATEGQMSTSTTVEKLIACRLVPAEYEARVLRRGLSGIVRDHYTRTLPNGLPRYAQTASMDDAGDHMWAQLEMLGEDDWLFERQKKAEGLDRDYAALERFDDAFEARFGYRPNAWCPTMERVAALDYADDEED